MRNAGEIICFEKERQRDPKKEKERRGTKGGCEKGWRESNYRIRGKKKPQSSKKGIGF